MVSECLELESLLKLLCQAMAKGLSRARGKTKNRKREVQLVLSP